MASRPVPPPGDLLPGLLGHLGLPSAGDAPGGGDSPSCGGLPAGAQAALAAARHASTSGPWQETPPQALPPSPAPKPPFYPDWEILPHEPRLPHADVIAERLDTLVALAGGPQVVVASVTALLQRTFAPAELRRRVRRLARGHREEPLDVVEWLEDQGYEPEAQVAQKGTLALRGGILDVWPPTAPWPVRLEFFGDELDSLRTFDPHTQVSREALDEAILCPAGELGLLKQALAAAEAAGPPALATLLDHLPGEAALVLFEPEELAAHAAAYAEQVPEGDPFHLPWSEFLAAAQAKPVALLPCS